MIKKSRIFLNSSDIYKDNTNNPNHADVLFPLDRADINCRDNEDISLSLVTFKCSNEISYIRNTGVNYIVRFSSSEAPTATGLSSSGGMFNSSCFIAFSDNIFQPPIVIASENRVVCAVPFTYASDIEALVIVMNACLDARMADGTDADPIFLISKENILTAVGSVTTGFLYFYNNLWDFNNTNLEFKEDSRKIARLLGINIRQSSEITSSTTQFYVNATVGTNRKTFEIYDVGLDGDSLLIDTNLNTDSFASTNNGVSSILSSIPIKMGVQHQYYTLEENLVGSTREGFLKLFRDGGIYHKNERSAVNNSHKTIGSKDLNNIRLQIKDSVGNQLFTNKNVFYEIEVIIFS